MSKSSDTTSVVKPVAPEPEKAAVPFAVELLIRIIKRNEALAAWRARRGDGARSLPLSDTDDSAW